MTVAVVTIVGMIVLMAARAHFLAPEGWSTLAPDEAQRAWHALQVTQGRLLYRDLWVQYTPLSFYWHALAFHVFGPSLGAIRLALVATGTLTLALVASAARRLGGPPGAVTAGALFLTFGVPAYNSGYPAWEAMAFSMAALAVVLRWRSSRAAFAAGLLVGLSMMTKINVGALSLLALIAVHSSGCSRAVRVTTALGCMGIMAWLLRSMPAPEALVQFLLPLAGVLIVTMRRSPPDGSIRAIAWAMAGCAVACVVALAPFAATLGPGRMIHAVIGEPLRFSRLIAYDSPVFRLGLPVYGTIACWMAALIIPLVAPKLKAMAVAAAAAGAIAFVLDAAGLLPGITVGARFLLVPILAVAVASQQWRGRVNSPLLAAAVWAALLHGQVYPGQSGMHVAWALIPAWAVLAGVVSAASRQTRAVWLLPGALAVVQLGHGALVYVRTDWARLDGQRGGIAVPRRDAAELAAVVGCLQGSEEPVLDLTSGCLIAFLSERPCPLGHAYFWRGFLTEVDQENEIRGLSRRPPPLAVRRHRGRDQFRWDAIAQYAPILARWVDGNYGAAERVGPYEVLALNDGMRE